jgi:CDP-diacylglycerol--serine O-phosphatidyltransferase
MKKRLIGVYHPSIVLTYAGVFCAVMGIGLLLRGQISGSAETLDPVMILLIISGVCDMFDGVVARSFQRSEQQKQFGIQLDSLADTVSFVAFPAAIVLFVTKLHPVGLVIACFYVFAGIMRLGWFNITTGENQGFYTGLPVTFSALIFPVGYLLLRLVNPAWLEIVFPALFVCVGLLFILNFRMKKPGMKALLALAALAVAVSISLLLI